MTVLNLPPTKRPEAWTRKHAARLRRYAREGFAVEMYLQIQHQNLCRYPTEIHSIA